MVFIDATVVNVALPALQRQFAADLADAQWVVASYALLLASLLLVGGAAGDRFGRRRVFAWGVAVFAVASIACGLSTSVRALIAARAIQGVGGALLVPGSLAIISASFDERERGNAIGIWSAATSLTTALGPVLGGWLIDHASWRAAFFLNVPLAAVVLALTRRHVPESRNASANGPIDWLGASLTTLALGGLVYALIEAPIVGWESIHVTIPVLVGTLALAAFIVAERRHPSPMVPLGLFRSRAFAGANVVTLLLYAALAGALFYLPLDLIQVQGYSTTAAGAALLPIAALLGVLSRWSGRLVDRYGARRPLIAGPLIAAVGFALLAVPDVGSSYWGTFFPGIVVLGLGMAITVAPLTTTVMNAVPTAHVGAASGINNAASRVAGLLAVAAFGVIIVPIFSRSIDVRLTHGDIAPAAARAIDAQRGRLAAILLPAEIDQADRDTAQRAIARAFVDGFRGIALVSGLLAFAGAVGAFFMIGSELDAATSTHREAGASGAASGCPLRKRRPSTSRPRA
jgi:EmrB/QacA subfamily drug resistance transporter